MSTDRRTPAVDPIDAYVLDTLMPDLVGHDGRPSALLVYLYFWHHTIARRVPAAATSLRAIAEGTGLSKRAVQDAIRHLTRRRLLIAHRDRPTAIPSYEVLRPWKRKPSRHH